jgi:small subunit ribosomal protein S4
LPGLIKTNEDLRRPYGPGQFGPTKKSKLSDFAQRLREKQKLRFHYGLSEKQLRKYVQKAFRTKKNTGLALLESLESRLDSIVFRAGFAPTIVAARQMTRHGHITVNGKKVDIPSYAIKAGDIVAASEKSKMREQMKSNRKDPNNLAMPSYIDIVDDALEAKITITPARDDIPVIVQEQMIIEFYSGR